MSFCTKCGAQMPDGSAFCTKCGAPMGQAAPAQAAPQAQPAQQFNQPQQGFQQPYAQQPYQPVDYMASLRQNAKVIKIIFACINAFLIISLILPYVSIEGYGDTYHYNRIAHGGDGDAFGLLIMILSLFTIIALFTLKNKLFITLTSIYNFLITLIMLIAGHKTMHDSYGVGHVFVIIALVFLGIGILGYFISSDDK